MMAGVSDLIPQTEAVAAYLRTRRLARTLRTPDDVTRWQSARLSQFLRTALPEIAFYRGLRFGSLSDLPIIDKSVLMQQFEAFNRLGLTAGEAWRDLARDGRHGHYFVGASTGTSGNRGLYVISEAERWRWLGTMLAKTLPRLRRAKVALILPLDTSLYAAARRSILDFRFIDLRGGLDEAVSAAAAFDPDTVIAPPRVLRIMAESAHPFDNLAMAFSAAEVLDPLDRAIIESRFNLTLREIYMATEGLLGVSCGHGTLHLSEDTMHIELEPSLPGSGLFTPIITDFSRTTQVMARYRMNDLLRLSPDPCPCGSPLRAIAQVEGRTDDILDLSTALGQRQVTPDILRNAIVSAHPAIDDFRLVQTGADTVELSVLAALPDTAAEAACKSLQALYAKLAINPRIVLLRPEQMRASTRKLRRVERQWHP